MALSPTDKKPTGIILSKAYSTIRAWYQAHVDQVLARKDNYSQASAALIQALPPSSALSDVEMIAVLSEVIVGYLEWAYHQSDGNYKMAAYAHAALETLDRSYALAPAEVEQLKKSSLWPYLSAHVKR